MNEFRTVVKPDKPAFDFGYGDALLSVGSCFSENVGKLLHERKFQITINPFGQQYNPASIAGGLHRLINPVPYTESELFLQDGLYHSYDHHGSFSRSTVKETLSGINSQLQIASGQLKRAKVLFITPGTSHVFRLKDSGKVVSNCHKVPASTFVREILSPDEIYKALNDVLNDLWKANPELKVVFTVSPVRYFAFGHYENSVSKAHLFTAIHRIQQQYASIYYFPAYEMVIDDLRDYRFFADDMLHPNHLAIDYVWNQLQAVMLKEESKKMMVQVEEILSACRHRPRDVKGAAHQKFVTATLAKISDLTKRYCLDFGAETTQLHEQLNG